MKKGKLVFFSLIMLGLACSNENLNDPKDKSLNDIEMNSIIELGDNISQSDSVALKKNDHVKIFKNFRESLQKKKKEEVSKIFDFPFHDESIWDFVYFRTDNYDYPHNLDFTKEDFMKNYDKIFSPDFISCLLMVDENILFEKGNLTTQLILIEEIEGLKVSCSMRSVYNKLGNSLELKLDYEFVEDGMDYESSLHYYFDFEDANLKLKKTLFLG